MKPALLQASVQALAPGKLLRTAVGVAGECVSCGGRGGRREADRAVLGTGTRNLGRRAYHRVFPYAGARLFHEQLRRHHRGDGDVTDQCSSRLEVHRTQHVGVCGHVRNARARVTKSNDGDSDTE
ncbi:hypothetical protein N9L76_02220 [bacterium]|nr:hypothetical protein [bacterium]